MKTLFTVIFALNVFCIFAQGYQTTDEEYNYLTIGYAQDVATGHDIKEGYSIIPFGNPDQMENYKVEISYFVKNDERKLAAVLVKMTANATLYHHIYYICIPIGNTTVTQRYYQDLLKLDDLAKGSFGQISGYLFAALAAREYDRQIFKR